MDGNIRKPVLNIKSIILVIIMYAVLSMISEYLYTYPKYWYNVAEYVSKEEQKPWVNDHWSVFIKECQINQD